MRPNLRIKNSHKKKDHQFSSKLNEIFRKRTAFVQYFFDKIKLNLLSPCPEKL